MSMRAESPVPKHPGRFRRGRGQAAAHSRGSPAISIPHATANDLSAIRASVATCRPAMGFPPPLCPMHSKTHMVTTDGRLACVAMTR